MRFHSIAGASGVRAFAIVWLGLTTVVAQAQVAAEERFQLTRSVASPWGKPIGRSLASNATLAIEADALRGSQPLECADAKHSFLLMPPEGWFEGALPAPALRSAAALGLPVTLVTQRIACSNASFDLHRSTDGRAWIALDNRVYEWQSRSLVASPRATVQSLLVQHFANGISVSSANLETNKRWLTETLHKKLQAWLKRSATAEEPSYLNGDPFTDSQEPPTSFEMAAPEMQGKAARVAVTFRDEGGARSVVYELAKKGSDWRIADVKFAGGERLSQLLER